MSLLIIGLFALLNIVEAKLESIVIALKNPSTYDYSRLNKQEHKWSAIYYGLICVLVTVALIPSLSHPVWISLLLVLLMLVLRRIFFDFGLKVFRKRPLQKIEGDGAVDKFMRKFLGANGGYKELFLLLALVVGIYFLIK